LGSWCKLIFWGLRNSHRSLKTYCPLLLKIVNFIKMKYAWRPLQKIWSPLYVATWFALASLAKASWHMSACMSIYLFEFCSFYILFIFRLVKSFFVQNVRKKNVKFWKLSFMIQWKLLWDHRLCVFSDAFWCSYEKCYN
jgi:hypothetical protein